MQRFENWQERLESFVIENQTRTWKYGEWDCFQFARGAVLAMAGVDLARGFRPYGNRFGYLRQLVEYCSTVSLFAFAHQVFAEFNSREVELPRAQRGDVVLIESGADVAFGVVALNGREVLALAPSGEIGIVPISSALAAWSI